MLTPPCYLNGLFDERRVAVAVCRASCPATFKAASPLADRPDRASCGAAAFTKQRVIVRMIPRDSRWPDDARGLGLSMVFAAWSEH